MKARKGRAKRPTRMQVSWTLVKAEPRVAILFWFFVAASAVILGLEFLVLFNVVARASWPLANKVAGLFRFALIADALVLASTFWGVRHFSIFSLLDRALTRLPIAALGLALMVYASYATLTKSVTAHRLADTGLMWAGSLMFFWVFLYYGRKRSTGGD